MTIQLIWCFILVCPEAHVSKNYLFSHGLCRNQHRIATVNAKGFPYFFWQIDRNISAAFLHFCRCLQFQFLTPFLDCKLIISHRKQFVKNIFKYFQIFFRKSFLRKIALFSFLLLTLSIIQGKIRATNGDTVYSGYRSCYIVSLEEVRLYVCAAITFIWSFSFCTF